MEGALGDIMPSTRPLAAGSGQPRSSMQPPQARGGEHRVAAAPAGGTSITACARRGSVRVAVANAQQETAAELAPGGPTPCLPQIRPFSNQIVRRAPG